MIAEIDRDGNGKISIEGTSIKIYSSFIFSRLEFAALIERQS